SAVAARVAPAGRVAAALGAPGSRGLGSGASGAQRLGEEAQAIRALAERVALRRLGERGDLRRGVLERLDLLRRREGRGLGRLRRLLDLLGLLRLRRDLALALRVDALAERADEVLDLVAIGGVALEVALEVLDRLLVAAGLRVRARDVVERVRVRE